MVAERLLRASRLIDPVKVDPMTLPEIGLDIFKMRPVEDVIPVIVAEKFTIDFNAMAGVDDIPVISPENNFVDDN